MPIEQIHPMIVHFPIVLAIAAVGFDLWGMSRPNGGTVTTRPFAIGTILLTAAGLMAILAFVFGDIAFDIARERGFPESVLEAHEGWGTTAMIVLIAVAAVRLLLWYRRIDTSRAGAGVAVVLSLVAALMVVVTAYYGGYLVYDLGVNIRPVG